MLHLLGDWYLKGATKEIQATSKFKLPSLGAGTQCAKCESQPENEWDGNQLALKSNRPPKRGPLGPHSGCKNV